MKLTRSSQFVACLLLAACSPSSPKLVEKPPAKFEKVFDKTDTVLFTPKVDILFVIDNSDSMSKHQNNLAKNIKEYTAELERSRVLDYHVGVITSSMDRWSPSESGKLVGNPIVIGRNTRDGARKLAANLMVGVGGSVTEEFFAPVQAALSPHMAKRENAGFYRKEAFLALVFITDADDQGYDQSPQEFHDYLVKMKGVKEKVIYYGAFIPSEDDACDRSGEKKPVRLEELLSPSMGDGTSFGLCDHDFGQKLAEIGSDLVKRVGRTLLLKRPPDVSTIEVRYGTQIIPNDARFGWTYDPARNALIFGKEIEFTEQPSGTEVEVNFIAAEYSDRPRSSYAE